MKIITFADIHYFSGNIENAIFNTKKKLVAYALPMLDKLTEKINLQHEVDVAINLGDLIQDTTERNEDLKALEFMFERLKRIKCPCYSVLGNHDLKMMNSVKEVEEIMGYESTYSFDKDGYHLVFLTTEVRSELGTERGGCYKAQYLSDGALRWLDTDLKQNALPCVIFTHYTLAEDATVTDECMFMKNRTEVKKILVASGNVKAVFSGHLHKTKVLEEDGIKYYVLGSMTACTKLEETPDGVYFEIDLDENGISVTEKHISKEEL